MNQLSLLHALLYEEVEVIHPAQGATRHPALTLGSGCGLQHCTRGCAGTDLLVSAFLLDARRHDCQTPLADTATGERRTRRLNAAAAVWFSQRRNL